LDAKILFGDFERRPNDWTRTEIPASPLRIPCSDHGRAIRVLYLEPIPRRTRPIGRGQPLRHDALESHLAGMLKERRAVLIGMFAEHDSEASLSDQLRQPLLAIHERQRPQVLAIELEQVEGIEHCLADGAMAMQRVEDRYAVRTAHDGFAIEDERPRLQLCCRARNRGIAGAPVVSAAGEEAHCVAFTADL
jgi:hypothetical protein